jgi:hypothetical protein
MGAGVFSGDVMIAGTAPPKAMTFGRIAGRNAAAEKPWQL